MNWLRHLPLKRKLNLLVVLTCLTVLAPMCAVLAIYQLQDFHRTLDRDTALADFLGRNAAAALASRDQPAARRTLSELEANPAIVSACLYNAAGRPFARYSRTGVQGDFPQQAPADGRRSERGWVLISRPVVLNGKRIGTICLHGGLQAAYDRLRWSAAVGLPVAALCVLAALALSSRLQRPIAGPILALAGAAKIVAARHDYSVRAKSQEGDEIGVLTEAFNATLAQIQEQNRALKESEERFRLLVESVPDYAIFGIDTQGRVSTWNIGAQRALGYQGPEIIGRDCTAFYDGEAGGAEKFAAELAAARTKGWFHCEGWRLRKDRTRFWASITVSAVRDAAGEPRGFVKVMQDITRRKEADQKLQTQLERMKLLEQITRGIAERQDLRSIFQVVLGRLEDQLPVGFACVCIYDSAAGALTLASIGVRSETLTAGLGWKENARIDVDQNGLSRCLSGRLVYEPDTARVPNPFPQRLAASGLRSIVLAPLQVESRVFGVLLAGRRETGAFSSPECEFLKQLSEHVALASHQAQLHAALQQAFDELRQSQQTVMQQERLRALGQMASGIAHDINNAIAPVSLYTESLLETERHLSERSRGQLQTIQRAIDDVANTVTRMREFYRQREPQLTSVPVPINLLVRQVIDLSRARWSDIPQQRGMVIQVATDLAPDLPPLMGVESEIREALVNLIFNAADAMPDGGTLALRTKPVQGEVGLPCVAVEVADTGIGMDEETRRRCLEPFFTTKGERGTGLGLAMVYGIVRRHGGDIEIDSAPGRGTTVRLVLPAGSIPAAPGKPEAELAVPQRLRILVVDDDPLVVRSLRVVLETDGHVVTGAHGGQEGIDAFRAACGGQKPFALVITDLGMPSVDGRQVAAAVKEASPATPVILLTGWGQQMLSEGDAVPHVDELLSKPPKLRDLRQALARWCHGRPKSEPAHA
jgi:PAS domain S-box-containing protein